MLRSLNYADAEVAFSLVTDAEIHELNREYLGRDRATNVLSFSLREGKFGDVNPGMLGDVAISVDTAKAQAETSGNTVHAETAYLVIHGLLHLLGYDHENGARGARAMRRLQNELFAAYGDLLEP